MKIGFWKVTEPYGFMSNWYLTKFRYKDHDFISSEQALMWSKAVLFNDSEIAIKILEEINQKNIKDLGRQVRNYDEQTWSSLRYSIMVDILLEKFRQNKKILKELLDTGDAKLYEASPYDAIWGIKSLDVNDPHGANLLGMALEEVREKLKRV